MLLEDFERLSLFISLDAFVECTADMLLLEVTGFFDGGLPSVKKRNESHIRKRLFLVLYQI